MTAEEKTFAILTITDFMQRIIKRADADGLISKKDVLSCKLDIVTMISNPSVSEIVVSTIGCINDFFRRIEVAIIRDGKTCVTVDLANEYYYLFLDDMAKSECTETESKEGAKE